MLSLLTIFNLFVPRVSIRFAAGTVREVKVKGWSSLLGRFFILVVI